MRLMVPSVARRPAVLVMMSGLRRSTVGRIVNVVIGWIVDVVVGRIVGPVLHGLDFGHMPAPVVVWAFVDRT